MSRNFWDILLRAKRRVNTLRTLRTMHVTSVFQGCQRVPNLASYFVNLSNIVLLYDRCNSSGDRHFRYDFISFYSHCYSL